MIRSTISTLLIGFFLCIITPGYLLAGEIKYPADAIPDSLKKSANAVIRKQVIVFELKHDNKATLTTDYAITILNKNALRHAYFLEPYDQFSKVRNIKGTVYDASGKLVKKFRNEDIMDISANTESSVFVDNRVKVIDPEYLKYPFTVEYSFETDYNGLMNYPDWHIYDDSHISIEQSVFTVIHPQDLRVRIYERNMDVEPEESIDDGKRTLCWKVKQHKAIENEPYSDGLYHVSPAVLTAPSDFKIDGYEGNCDTWQNFGKWIYTLNKDRGIFPEETKQKIRALIRQAKTEEEKARILYKYMQDNTRYVSVQIGIGGWQPLEAELVDRLSYGDCKALTNYMRALLEVAGIESYYTLVRAGSNAADIITEFPSNQFNHAILCALVDSDTVWLECTSQRLPFGYTGSFTDDRDVLLVNAQGGKMVRTNIYAGQGNHKICNATVELDDYGFGRISVDEVYKGMFYDKRLPVLLSDDHDQEQRIRQSLHLPNFELQGYTIGQSTDGLPAIEESLELTVEGFGIRFGNRMVINLNMLNKIGDIPSKKEKRQSEILVRRSFVESDTVTYRLPPGYAIEKVSEGRTVQSEFGSLTTTVNVAEAEIQYIRHLEVNQGTWPADAYGQFYDFYNTVKQSDKDRIILVRK